MPLPPPLYRLTTALLVVFTLTLPAAVNAQTVGQNACPDGVMQIGWRTELEVTNVTHDRATLAGGVLAISRSDIESLSDVTGDFPRDWQQATLYTGVRGYGYPDGVQDARKVPFTDGDLVHGVWLNAGRVNHLNATVKPKPSTTLSLEPSTKYVAQIVVGELRNSKDDVVTNQFVSGVGAPISGNKPKPVLT